MKIEIDNEGASYSAKITIDGRTVEIGIKADGSIRADEGQLSHREARETLGGLILNNLASVVIRILQAEAFAAEAHGVVETPRSFTWERLERGAFLAAEEQFRIPR